MQHVPSLATIYHVDVADEAAAREVAHALVERGHAMVCIAPDDEPRWKVASIDEGPYPNDDEGWWRATEARIIADSVRAAGGVYRGCSHSGPETARDFFGQGEVVADRSVEEVRELRTAVLSLEPARAPAPVIVHRLADLVPSDGPPGEPVRLQGLDDVDWASLSHAYGPADDAPDVLRRLAANDEGWDEAVHDFFSAIVHQGTCYSATPHAIGFLVQLACAPRLLPEYRFELLGHLAYVASIDPVDDFAAFRAITDRLPGLLSLWPDVPAAARAWLIVLAAAAPDAATDLLPDFREFRQQVEGPSPTLDLALALVAGDDDAALDLTLAATTWDETVPRLLEEPSPLRTRQLKILVRLAMTELSPRASA